MQASMQTESERSRETPRILAILRAKELLAIMRADPMKYRWENESLTDVMTEFDLSFKELGTTEQAYRFLDRLGGIARTKTYFKYLRAGQAKDGWLYYIDKEKDWFGLTFEEMDVKETEYLKYKRWFARLAMAREAEEHARDCNSFRLANLFRNPFAA